MKLKVPLFRQKKDTNDCGIVGIQMILHYYGDNISYEELKSNLKTDNIGTYMPQLGVYLLKKGYEVEIVTLNPKLFTLSDKGKEKDLEFILERFEMLKNNSKSEQDKKTIDYFVEYLKVGGKIKIKMPSKEDIDEEIKQNRPVCALLTTNFLYGEKPVFNFHFNVITGLENDKIYANDPLWDERGGEKVYNIDEFFYGIYASAYGDLDNASLLKIKKKY